MASAPTAPAVTAPAEFTHPLLPAAGPVPAFAAAMYPLIVATDGKAPGIPEMPVSYTCQVPVPEKTVGPPLTLTCPRSPWVAALSLIATTYMMSQSLLAGMAA